MNRVELLRKAVAKWSKIAVGLGIDERRNNCSLCNAYRPNCGFGMKEECPVYSHTGHEQCRFTPWEEWRDHHDNDHWKSGLQYFMRPMCGKCRELANKELMFLQMLLEKEKCHT